MSRFRLSRILAPLAVARPRRGLVHIQNVISMILAKLQAGGVSPLPVLSTADGGDQIVIV
jgi:hypothetical protein